MMNTTKTHKNTSYQMRICLDWCDLLLSERSVRAAISILVFFILLFAYAPGGMNSDSYWLNELASANKIVDLHSPFLIKLWHWLLYLQNTQFPLFVVSIFMLSLGSYFLSGLHRQYGAPGTQWLWILFPLLPPVIGHAGRIMIDALMAFALYLAYACFCLWKEERRKIFVIGAATSVFFALLVRHNTILAIFPVIAFLLYWRKPQGVTIKKIIYFGIAISSLYFCIYSVNYFLLGAIKMDPVSYQNFRVVYATSVETGENFFLRETSLGKLTVKELMKTCQEAGWGKYSIITKQEINKSWKELIINHPGAWLKGKLRVIYSFLSGWDLFSHYRHGNQIYSYFISNTNPGDTSLMKESRIRNKIKCYVDIFNKVPGSSRPLFWICINCLVFICGCIKSLPRRRALLLVSSSAIFYFFSFMIVTPPSDFRYYYWPVLAATMGIIILMYSLLSVIRVRHMRG